MSAKFFTFVGVVLLVVGALFVPPLAAAAPPGFPDVNSFIPVSPHRYLASDKDEDSVHFSTPEGVSCWWVYGLKALETNPLLHVRISCSGNIPGIPDFVPDNGGVGCARVVSRTLFSQEYVFDRHGGFQCPPFLPWTHVLNAGQRIETADATCVVGEGGLIACINPVHDHGFVLQPSGSWVF